MGIASQSPAPFVVGVSRSGTTLLRLMLDTHPEVAIPAEVEASGGLAFVLKLIRARERDRTNRVELARFDPDACWLSDLQSLDDSARAPFAPVEPAVVG